MSLNDQYTAAIAEILRRPDPVAARDAWCRAPETSPALRALLEAADADGLRMSALLITQLRFNRLLNGSPEAAVHFRSDPQAFSRRFQAYHHAIPPHPDNPVQEARAFAAWVRSTESDCPDPTS